MWCGTAGKMCCCSDAGGSSGVPCPPQSRLCSSRGDSTIALLCCRTGGFPAPTPNQGRKELWKPCEAVPMPLSLFVLIFCSSLVLSWEQALSTEDACWGILHLGHLTRGRGAALLGLGAWCVRDQKGLVPPPPLSASRLAPWSQPGLVMTAGRWCIS